MSLTPLASVTVKVSSAVKLFCNSITSLGDQLMISQCLNKDCDVTNHLKPVTSETFVNHLLKHRFETKFCVLSQPLASVIYLCKFWLCVILLSIDLNLLEQMLVSHRMKNFLYPIGLMQ